MRIVGWLVLLGLALLMVFAAANWPLLTETATLNLLVLTLQGPLGLILLGATVVLAALFAIYALSLRTASLVETRKHLKELDAQRGLAEKAEASRFTALGSQLEGEFATLRKEIDELRMELIGRLDTLETATRHAVDESGNALFASLGQIDDKLDRGRPQTQTQPETTRLPP